MTKCYRAPWGRSVKLVTLFASVLLVGFPLTAMALGFSSGILSVILIIPLLIWVFTLPFVILGYELTPEELRIVRLGWKSVFPLRSLSYAEHKPNAMSRSLRIFGNGGLFSVCGRFRNRELGNYRAFVTDPKNAVVLRNAEQTIVISPEGPQEFIEALEVCEATREGA